MTCHGNVTRDVTTPVTVPRPDPTRPDPFLGYDPHASQVSMHATKPIDKWSQIDARKVAHWWLGAEGTACGLDFRASIHRAYADDPRCSTCAAYLIEAGIDA